jgi:hypothetical protein
MQQLRILAFSVGALLLPCAAGASVGAVSALDGEASRTSRAGATAPLAEGTAIELGDVLRVKRGALKLTLNDQSQVMLAQGSDLEISEADFAGQERRSFVAKLGLGALWAKVTKAAAGSDAKFEVHTDRAVAGVRGTVFQVEVVSSGGVLETHVGVIEGKVAVERRNVAPMVATAPPKTTAAAAGARVAIAPAPPAPAPAGPAPAAGTLLLAAGEGVHVDEANLARGLLRRLPAQFERFIGEHGAERPHDLEHREQHHEEREHRRER